MSFMLNNFKKLYKQTSRKKVNILAASVVLLAVFTSVIVINYPSQSQVANVDTPQPVIPGQTELLPENLSNIKPISEIQSLANSNSQISGIELEYQEGVLVYVVVFSDGSKQVYDAYNATALGYKGSNNTDIDSQDRLPPNFNPATSIVDALTAAKIQKPDMAATKIDIVIETSLTLYGVHFANNDKLFVSTASGNIVTIPDPEPVIYTASTTTTPVQSNVSTTNNKDWRDNWKKNKNDRRKKLEDYINSYYNRD
jgi:hypothetical protein